MTTRENAPTSDLKRGHGRAYTCREAPSQVFREIASGLCIAASFRRIVGACIYTFVHFIVYMNFLQIFRLHYDTPISQSKVGYSLQILNPFFCTRQRASRGVRTGEMTNKVKLTTFTCPRKPTSQHQLPSRDNLKRCTAEASRN